MVRQVFGSNLGIEKLKLGFCGEKWVFPELLSDRTSCFINIVDHIIEIVAVNVVMMQVVIDAVIADVDC
ncbi:hypothetical protein MTR_5g046925 [Medicago truncatula]|uniref:Uncharacterized protein n=1 Tax=Medicago truncatula TaxID=3880 RepID=A0A072UPX4_MEDTR|nr:hypothetical protein MTR_5g046925 [Medicago truncatula]